LIWERVFIECIIQFATRTGRKPSVVRFKSPILRPNVKRQLLQFTAQVQVQELWLH